MRWAPERLECRPSRRKSLGLLLMTAALLGTCWFCTTLPGWDAQAVGWVGLAFFGLAGVMLVRQAVRIGPVVVIDADGLTDRRLGVGPIGWQEITGYRTVTVESTRLLCLDLAEPDQFLGRLSAWKRVAAAANRRMGFGDVCVGFVGLSPGIDEAEVVVRRWLRNRP